MAWLLLIAAGIFEICWAVGLKLSNGFTIFKWSAFTVVTYIISVVLLGFALKSIPLGTCYAIWTGIGMAGTVIIGMIYFNESKDLLKVIFISMILIGIVGLKFITPEN